MHVMRSNGGTLEGGKGGYLDRNGPIEPDPPLYDKKTSL